MDTQNTANDIQNRWKSAINWWPAWLAHIERTLCENFCNHQETEVIFSRFCGVYTKLKINKYFYCKIVIVLNLKCSKKFFLL